MIHRSNMKSIFSPTVALFLATLCTSTWAAMAVDPAITPETIQQTICQANYTLTVRPYTSYTRKVKRELLRESGHSQEDEDKYELDHIVPLVLGGHPSSRDNLTLQLWPEAKRKDRIEVKLQCLVCSGQVPLAQAQQEMYSDWQAAYGKYSRVKCHRARKK